MINFNPQVSSNANIKSPVRKGKNVGTGIGFAAGAVYVAKNGRETIQHGVKEASKYMVHVDETLTEKAKDVLLISNKQAVGIGVAVLAATIALSTVAGRIIGGAVGKIVQNHKEHKAEKKSEQKVENKVKSKHVKNSKMTDDKIPAPVATPAPKPVIRNTPIPEPMPTPTHIYIPEEPTPQFIGATESNLSYRDESAPEPIPTPAPTIGTPYPPVDVEPTLPNIPD